MCAQRAPLAQDRHVVVHVDIDAFFVQVRCLLLPEVKEGAHSSHCLASPVASPPDS